MRELTLRLVIVILLIQTIAVPITLYSHEIPTNVTVRVFIKPEAQQLTLLVRVPLAAMRDMQVPTREKGFLDLAHIDNTLRDAATLWISDYIRLYEENTLLSESTFVNAHVSLPSNRSFDRYEDALNHINGSPLPLETEIYWDQAMLDVAFEYPIQSDNSRFSINPGLERLGLHVINVIRFLHPDGVVRSFDFPGNPGRVPLDPQWHQVVLKFVELGFFHILDGIDHLLFLFCLIIPFRRFRPLVLIITSFTVAHSITLIAAALGLTPNTLWFPPLVETLIAVSIIYMAFENIAGAELRRRWLVTFVFGLVHGFGFSFILSDTLQFAGSHLLMSLLAFNAGVELGQLLVLAFLLPALTLLFKFVAVRFATISLSVLVIHSAWHWMTERFNQLMQYDWLSLNGVSTVRSLRLLMLFITLAGICWVVSVVSRPRVETSRDKQLSDIPKR